MIRRFIRIWGLWRLILVCLATVATIVGLVLIREGGSRLTLMGIYFSVIVGLFTIVVPTLPPDQGTSPVLVRILRWWDEQRLLTRRVVQGVVAAVFIVTASLLVVDISRGEPIPARLSPSVVRLTEGTPVRFTAQGAASGNSLLNARLRLAPTSKLGYCVAPAVINLTPVLDGQPRYSATRQVRSEEITALEVGGPFDRVELSATVETTPGCIMDLSVQEAYYGG